MRHEASMNYLYISTFNSNPGLHRETWTLHLWYHFHVAARGQIWLGVVSMYLPSAIFVTDLEKVLICCGQRG